MSASSSDEETFKSNINLPNYNLRKKQPKPNRKRNLAKAGQKLKSGGKSVRFPLNTLLNRQSTISTSTKNDDSSDSDFLLQEGASVEPEFDSNLPNFTSFNPGIGTSSRMEHMDDESEEDEDEEDEDDVDRRLSSAVPQYSDDDDSSDNEPVHPFEQPPVPLQEQQTRRSSQSSHNILRKNSRQNSVGTDITDQREDATSSRSLNSEEKATGFKQLLRRMTLVGDNPADDAAFDAPSASDTFLGRVLSLSQNGGTGLSGGGLAPGGSRQTDLRLNNIDEESEVGLDPEDPMSEAIELKRMDFAKLSEEAQHLISGHVPESKKLMRHLDIDEDHEESPTGRSQDLDKENTETNHSAPPNEKAEEFLAPNPDLFLRGEGRHEDDDYMMLDEEVGGGYIPPPSKVHAGVLSSLLKLYQNPQEAKSSGSFVTTSGGTTLAGDQDDDYMYEGKHPGTADFKKIKKGIRNAPRHLINAIPGSKKKTTLADTSNSSGESPTNEKFGSGNDSEDGELDESARALPSFQNAKPKLAPKKQTNVKVPKFTGKNKKNKLAQQLRITVHIADILQRQRFILRMCKALMLFGAPTHRLEEYMIMTSRVLEIDGQFIYFPGCMIVAFGDAATRTSEVHLVRCAQGLNLSKLSDSHAIYKSVIHDYAGVEESAVKLEELLKRKNLYPPWMCVLFFGIASSMVAPFAFGGGWYDIPICFFVGCCVGYLQFFVSSKSNLYSSVFEVTSSIVVSFIARGIGSISGGHFCFAAIAQGSLALILPGYIILCGSLELQSRNLVAGSVRMFYAIIYSLFLGFGITLGASLFGWVYKDATSDSECPAGHNMSAIYRIIFVPIYSVILGLINQASWKQLPVMVVISSIGYIANYFAGKHFSNVTEFTAAIGAFVVGILGNMYSRIWKGMAVSAMLPAIFVQVPSGIASQSTLLTGITTADQITGSNGTTTTTTTNNSTSALLFGATMVEVSIGISVGLFAAALCVYPFGKKRTSLFTL